MNYRKFGNTDLMVSEIGFGCWAIGGGAMVGNTPIGWGAADDATSKEAIHTALALGINFFDTADIYGLGHSETLLGEIIGNRPDIIIATKVGNVSRHEKFTTDYSKEYILSACDASLKRLKRDVIDYYQLHSARIANLQNGECIAAMQELQQQGKIRYWGLSLPTFQPGPEADYLIQNKLGNGFQLVLNIINKRALPLVKKAAATGYGVIARMPLQFGLLTGKFDTGASFPDNDHRKNRLTNEIITGYNKQTKDIWQLCEKYGITKTQLALSYILSYAAVSSIIPGIRTKQQAESNTTGLVKLEKEDVETIENTDMSGLMNIIEKQG